MRYEEKELIGMFLKTDIKDFDKYAFNYVGHTDREEQRELNDLGYRYWNNLYKKVMGLIKAEKNINFLTLKSYCNAGGMIRELKISIHKGDVMKMKELIITPHTSGEIKYLIVRKEK